MKKFKHVLSVSALTFAGMYSTVSHAAMIDFEAYSTQNFSNSAVFSGTTFTNISAATDPRVRIFNNGGTRTAFILACDIAGGFDCTNQLEVDFGQAVTNLSFDFVSDESSSVSGSVEAYLNGSLISSIPLIGDGISDTAEHVSLAALGALDRLVLNPNLDPAGLGYDNFSFNTSAVPVPGAIWLLGSSLTGFIGIRKMRKKT